MPPSNPNGRAAIAYQEQDIRSADPVALVAHLYGMAGAQLARARSALAAGDLAAKGLAVHRAGRCIGVLQESLDIERGGEVAANLDRLYVYVQRRLAEAHMRNDATIFAELLGLIGELGGAWREVAGRAPAVAAHQPAVGAVAASAAR